MMAPAEDSNGRGTAGSGFARSIVARVDVGDHDVRLLGSRKALEHAVARTDPRPVGLAPTFERKWRTQEDSNLWPLPSEGSALSS